MIGGFLTTIIWVLVFKAHFFDFYEMIPGFVAGTVLTIGVSLLTKPPDGARKEWLEVHQAVRKPARQESVQT